jgi:hypothetical protein
MFTCLTANAFDSSDFLDRLAIIESNNNPNAVGDNKKAIGAYQMHECAYLDALAWLRINRPDLYEYYKIGKIINSHKEDCKDPDISRVLALAYISIMVDRLKQDGQKVTPFKVYMCYNMGYKGAFRCNFNMDNVVTSRRITLKRAKLILDTPLRK